MKIDKTVKVAFCQVTNLQYSGTGTTGMDGNTDITTKNKCIMFAKSPRSGSVYGDQYAYFVVTSNCTCKAYKGDTADSANLLGTYSMKAGERYYLHKQCMTSGGVIKYVTEIKSVDTGASLLSRTDSTNSYQTALFNFS